VGKPLLKIITKDKKMSPNPTKHPKGSPQYINKLNKIRILHIIRERNKISRADIAKISGISAPTVTRIVDSLIKDTGLIHEVGIGVSSGGRRPTLVELSNYDNYVIGIDLGTTHIDGVLANLYGETIVDIRCETIIQEGSENIFEKLSNIICELQNHPKAGGKRILGVGLAVPGLINRYENIIEVSPDLHWESVDLEKILSQKCDLPLKFDNVTRVMALGELWYGIGDVAKHFAVINIGYGIGAGIVIDGKLLYGPFGMAGEFGHIIMDKDSKIRCECGNYGCLEALASGHAIAQRAGNAISSGEKSILMDMVNNDISKIDTKLIAEAARKGDNLSKRIFDEAVDYLGTGVSSLINLISPEMVLIGGGVSQAEDLIFDKVKDIVKRRTIKTRTRNIVIKPVSFGVNAATKGAVALILNEVLNLNYLNPN
jgi:glucokinase-like ROK family protein